MSNYEHVLTDLKDGIFTITFNRPEVRNAFNWRQQWEFNCALDDANENADARVVVITGAGKGFSGGLDLKNGMNGWGKPLSDRKIVEINELLFKRFRKPTIAAVNGAAVGWGCTLTLLCDMRFAAESAYFSMRFVRVGLIPEGASPYILPKLVGHAKAMELGLTGRDVPAKEAAEIGMINGVYPDAELLPKVYATAAMIADNPAMSVELARRGFIDALDQTFEEQQIQEHRDFYRCVASEEHRKRAANFAKTKKYT